MLLSSALSPEEPAPALERCWDSLPPPSLPVGLLWLLAQHLAPTGPSTLGQAAPLLQAFPPHGQDTPVHASPSESPSATCVSSKITTASQLPPPSPPDPACSFSATVSVSVIKRQSEAPGDRAPALAGSEISRFLFREHGECRKEGWGWKHVSLSAAWSEQKRPQRGRRKHMHLYSRTNRDGEGAGRQESFSMPAFSPSLPKGARSRHRASGSSCMYTAPRGVHSLAANSL